MTTDKEVMQMALDALEESKKHLTDQRRDKTIESLRARLAQGEPEPVAYKVTSKLGEYCGFKSSAVKKGDLIYTTPPQREWQSLTDEEKADLIWKSDYEPIKIARAIEAKLKEKNNGQA